MYEYIRHIYRRGPINPDFFDTGDDVSDIIRHLDIAYTRLTEKFTSEQYQLLYKYLEQRSRLDDACQEQTFITGYLTGAEAARGNSK